VAPWHEFRREGNSLFLYSLLVGFAVLLALALVGLPIWLPLLAGQDLPSGPGFVLMMIALVSVVVALSVVLALITTLMVPIMYRRRCGAFAAFRAALAMTADEPAAVILYLLFVVALWIAGALLACVVTCVTCCLAAVPYLGTVILLPIDVFFASYLLLFMRQFGPDFDVWANIVTPAPAPAGVASAAGLGQELPPAPAADSPPARDVPPPPPPPPLQT